MCFTGLCYVLFSSFPTVKLLKKIGCGILSFGQSLENSGLLKGLVQEKKKINDGKKKEIIAKQRSRRDTRLDSSRLALRTLGLALLSEPLIRLAQKCLTAHSFKTKFSS